MANTFGPVCTCYRAWHSITPPPPCPVHASPWSWTWITTTPTVATASSTVTQCRGRHCAHDSTCGTYYLQNGG